ALPSGTSFKTGFHFPETGVGWSRVGEDALDVLARQHRDLQHHFEAVRDPESNRAAVWLETVKLISAHIAVERSFVYPIVKRQRIGGSDLADLLRHEYRSMEHLVVLTERRKINSPDMPELITKLLDVFEEHLDRCENQLGPALRASLGQGRLDELGV